MQQFRRIYLNLLLGLACVGYLAACESGGGGGGGDKQDFGDNDKNTVVCQGDSITEGDCVPAGAPYPSRLAQMTGKNVINQGSCGEKSSGGADRVDTILDRYSPGYLCILYGANDAIFNRSVDSVIGNLRYMIQSAKNNKTVPIVATLTPVYDGHAFASGNVQLYSDAIRQLAKDEGVKLADLNKEFGTDRSLLQPDGLHPSDAGNQLIAMVFNDKI